MKIKVAMLTGYHPYEVIQFQEMLCSLSEFEIYLWNDVQRIVMFYLRQIILRVCLPWLGRKLMQV